MPKAGGRHRSGDKPWFDELILTCEHGGNRIPAKFLRLFRGAQKVLATHRGMDIGALAVADLLAQATGAPLFATTISRLLIDLNRSLSHPRVYSEFTHHLPPNVRKHIAARYYNPHRDTVAEWIQTKVAKNKRVLHLGIHSFTPELHGLLRNTEIGLLYDSKRSFEKTFAQTLQQYLAECIDHAGYDWRLRRNYPYNGAADGFTTTLRTIFPQKSYVGIEIELNQAIIKTVYGQRHAAKVLAEALQGLVPIVEV